MTERNNEQRTEENSAVWKRKKEKNKNPIPPGKTLKMAGRKDEKG